MAMSKFSDIMTITAASLEKYLLFNNWIRDYDYPNKNMMVFHNEEDILAFPASERLSDFYIAIPNVIKILSELQDKEEKEIIKEITTSYHDKIEFRIKSKSAEKGKLPLGYAARCIDGLKELILYSACAEQNKEPICLKATSNAKEVLNNFKLGQTEVGSFVINIDIQVVDDVNEQITLDNTAGKVATEHKIVKRIGHALGQVEDVNAEKVKLDELLPTAYEDGITANMCDALLKLKPENEDIEIETKIRYASSITKKTDSIETVSLKRNHFSIMNEISNRYRQIEDVKEILLTGDIASLRKKRSDAGHFQREIIINVFYDGSYRNIKSELGEDDYRVACDAHRDELRVEISGMLDMSKKTWEFTHVNSFNVINT